MYSHTYKKCKMIRMSNKKARPLQIKIDTASKSVASKLFHIFETHLTVFRLGVLFVLSAAGPRLFSQTSGAGSFPWTAPSHWKKGPSWHTQDLTKLSPPIKVSKSKMKTNLKKNRDDLNCMRARRMHKKDSNFGTNDKVFMFFQLCGF